MTPQQHFNKHTCRGRVCLAVDGLVGGNGLGLGGGGPDRTGLSWTGLDWTVVDFEWVRGCQWAAGGVAWSGRDWNQVFSLIMVGLQAFLPTQGRLAALLVCLMLAEWMDATRIMLLARAADLMDDAPR